MSPHHQDKDRKDLPPSDDSSVIFGEEVSLREFSQQIYEISRRWQALLGVLLRQYKIGTSRFLLLTELEREGALTLTQVARCLLSKKSTATNIIDGMVRDGLVQRERASCDRRVVTVLLTPEGETLSRRIRQEMLPLLVHHIEQILHDFSQEEIESIFSLLKKLNENMEH